MGNARRLAAALAVLTLSAGAASGGPVVYLRPSAVVPPGGLALGAIAAVACDDAALAADLAALPLGEAPRRLCFLPPQEVRRRVARAFPGQVDLVGSGVALLPAGVVPARLEAQAAALLAALGREDQGQGWLEVELLSGLPEEASAPVLMSRPPRGRLSGRLQVQIGETGVLLFAHPYAAVARASRDLERGSLLEEGDVQFVETDLSGLPGGYLTELEGSFRVLAPIPRGALLEPSRLARSFLVKAGDRVTVVFLRPGLSVTLPGRALGSAGRGETVEVSLRDPARRFRGRVEANGEVVVEQL